LIVAKLLRIYRF